MVYQQQQVPGSVQLYSSKCPARLHFRQTHSLPTSALSRIGFIVHFPKLCRRAAGVSSSLDAVLWPELLQRDVNFMLPGTLRNAENNMQRELAMGRWSFYTRFSHSRALHESGFAPPLALVRILQEATLQSVGSMPVHRASREGRDKGQGHFG
jgi:hypothetical protein